MIHVLGLGRSGTNLLHQLLCSNPFLECIKAESILFHESVSAAVYPEIIREYIKELKKIKHHTFKVIKNHPEMWFWGAIPYHHKGIIIRRDVKDHVASVLNHDGVLHWVKHQYKYPPNGLSGNYLPNFYDLSIIERCVIRWANAVRYGDNLERDHRNITIVSYDQLLYNPSYVLEEISYFLSTPFDYDMSIIKPKSNKFDRLPEVTKNKIELAIKEFC